MNWLRETVTFSEIVLVLRNDLVLRNAEKTETIFWILEITSFEYAVLITQF